MKNGSNRINIILNTFPGYQKPKLKNIYFVFDNEIVGYENKANASFGRYFGILLCRR